MQVNANPVLMRETKVAELLGVTVHALRKWRVQGRGPRYVKFWEPGKNRRTAAVRYDEQDARLWLDSRLRGGSSPDSEE